MITQQAVIFISHGSPMMALSEEGLPKIWREAAHKLPRPDAIVVVSAHWTTRLAIVTGSKQPETIHDFNGFPSELYRLKYPAAGRPALAIHIKKMLNEAGILTAIDASRGIDHGAWIPLRAMYPEADIPVLQLSIQPECGARYHYAMGAALARLSHKNVLVLASGHMTHNLHEYMQSARTQPAPESVAFRDWVHQKLVEHDDQALFNWEQEAPNAPFAHPTVEHFLPLFVALGAAGAGRCVESLGGAWLDTSLAADNYIFWPSEAEDISG